jgi:hypothetical protein
VMELTVGADNTDTAGRKNFMASDGHSRLPRHRMHQAGSRQEKWHVVQVCSLPEATTATLPTQTAWACHE